MSRQESYSLHRRLKSIRREISDLKGQPVTSVKDRIQMLKKINDLLREQNRILVIRQAYLGAKAG